MALFRPLVLGMCILLPLSSFSEPATKTIKATRTKEQILIDGQLLEHAWSSPGNAGFLQKDPDEGLPATQNTEV